MQRKAWGAPLAWIAVVFALGIRVAALVPPMPWSWLAVALCAMALVRIRQPVPLLLMCFLLGGARGASSGPGGVRAGPAVDDRRADAIRGVVVGPVEDRATGGRFVIRADGPVRARVLVTVRDRVRAPVLPGDRVEVVARLRSPRGYRVPGAVDARRVAAAQGADLVVSAPASAVVRLGRSRSAWRLPARLQRWMSDLIAGRGGDAQGRSAVRAMVAGDRGGVDDVMAERFRRAGASHLLAVSGLHLAVVTLLLFAFVRRLWAAVPALVYRARASLVAAAVAWPAAIAYTAATGARVSTLRALLVVTIVLWGAAVAKRARIIDALGAAAIALLFLSPDTLYDPSFQLSFSATAVLCVAVGRRVSGAPETRWARFASYAIGLVRASFWATVATAPFTASAFGTVAPGGVVANVFVVPLAEMIVLPVALLGVALSAVSTGAGGVLIDLAVGAASVTLVIVDVIGSHTPVVSVPTPRWWELILCVGAVAAGVATVRGVFSRRCGAGLVAVAIAGLAVSWTATSVVAPRLRTGLRVTFVDVGQGDAAVVEFPGGAVWLIDAGGRPFVVGDQQRDGKRLQRLAEAPGERAVLRYLSHRRVRRIERVIVTHPHPDHYVGLAAVARALPIDEVWIPRAHPERPDPVPFSLLMWELHMSGTSIRSPHLGTHEHHGAGVEVLHPSDDGRHASSDPALGFNDNSLVVRLDFAGRRLLFLGDVEEEAEEILTREARPDALRADLVKVPHHGSRTSSSEPLVKAVSARWAVVSCGVANRFGFPAPAVVNRWRGAGATVLRTDLGGSITATVARNGALKVRAMDAY